MTTEDTPSYYAEFGIDRAAGADAISGELDRAFRSWSSRASRAPDPRKRREAEDKVELIARARAVLLDPAKRRAYDRDLDRPKQRPGPPEPPPRVPPPAPPTRNWVAEARKLIAQGNEDGALYELRQAVHFDDRDPEAWRMLGAIHTRRHQWDDALQEFQRALALQPRDAPTHTAIARVHEQLGAPATAATWHLAAARLTPGDVVSQVAAADSLYRAGRYDEALSGYEQALAQRPGNAAVRDQIGRIWSQRAEGAMVWHPKRQRYAVASAQSVPMVTHCVDQALAVGVSDVQLSHRLASYRDEASRALTRTWRWRKSMGRVMALCFVLMFVPANAVSLAALVAFFVLPIAMGTRPRWRHTYDQLPVHQRPQRERAR
ncbi:tetratricopeptide repeat protein [Streptomyces sp. DW26H14]|uniref:tetratricopeptide repeat protein n=1 Tax=Streptomyces sp. DW26H14 TaxID=3435395 RepID=UPI00403DB075